MITGGSAPLWTAGGRTLSGLIYSSALGVIISTLGLFPAARCWAQQTITVSPGDDLQSLVNANPGNTKFAFTAGIYRLQSIVPKDHDQFVGLGGAILSGAALLTSFSQSGSTWVSPVQVTGASSYRGTCLAASPLCTYPEDLFFDNVPKQRVASSSAVGPGKWYLSYSTGKVYMGDNPSGHTVEISLLPHAFSGLGLNVIIFDLTIEKYASVAGDGAVNGTVSNGWGVEWCELRYNHGLGIQSGNGMYILRCLAHHNGQMGIGGGGNNVTMQNCQIYNNNYAGYNWYWEAGGVKFTGATNLKVQYSYSHNNQGPGFWTDVNCQYVLYDGNRTDNNVEAGILHELSYDATITSNYIAEDGFNPGHANIWWGAGILISNSSNVTVTNNNVIDCMNGIGGLLAARGNGPNGQPYLTQNLNVSNNTITENVGTAAGIVAQVTFDNSVYTSWNNHFQNNTFNLTNPTGLYFNWLGQAWTLAQWNTYASEH